MKTFARILSLSAALFVAFATTAKAQLTTFETISSWTGSVYTFTANRVYAQTFSNVLQVESMTYRFASASNSAAALNLSASFVEWNNTSNVSTAIGSVVQNVGSITVPATSTWSYDSDLNVYYFDYTITLSQVTNPSLTYALVLTSTTSSTIGLSFSNDDSFALGDNVRQTNAGGALTNLGTDWGFSQLVVEPAPTPESGTVAAIAGALLVAGLVGFRLRQRRQPALAPVVAAA
jgi:hypothetical protein